MKLKFFLLCAAIGSCSIINAATLDDAKTAYSKGEYTKALPIFMEQYKKNPANGSINQWIGVCLYKTGRINESKKYFETASQKKVQEANRYLASLYYDTYDFKNAESSLAKYEADLRKTKKELPNDMKKLQKQLLVAPVMLDHVEKIVIIDSISVDKEQFFKAYNLSKSSGRLDANTIMPESIRNNNVDMVYTTENGDRILWAATDAKSVSHLYEMSRLLGGEWDKPERLADVLNDGGNAKYPFLMQDGTTLYYASDGDSSIGGYDIYMSRKDIDTGKYLQPQNMGMPYNSPYNDYLLAIDEENNIGWWATDRNQTPDKVTIYVFIPNGTRQNYSADDSDVVSEAFIRNYRSTWNGKDYSSKVDKIRTLRTDDQSQSADFTFHIYNGITYHSLADFKTKEGASMMEELLNMQVKQNSSMAKLKKLRKKYENSSATEKSSLKNEILQLENSIDKSRIDIKWMENSIRKVEHK